MSLHAHILIEADRCNIIANINIILKLHNLFALKIIYVLNDKSVTV
jgi:hypothetical protein